MVDPSASNDSFSSYSGHTSAVSSVNLFWGFFDPLNMNIIFSEPKNEGVKRYTSTIPPLSQIVAKFSVFHLLSFIPPTKKIETFYTLSESTYETQIHFSARKTDVWSVRKGLWRRRAPPRRNPAEFEIDKRVVVHFHSSSSSPTSTAPQHVAASPHPLQLRRGYCLYFIIQSHVRARTHTPPTSHAPTSHAPTAHAHPLPTPSCTPPHTCLRPPRCPHSHHRARCIGCAGNAKADAASLQLDGMDSRDVECGKEGGATRQGGARCNATGRWCPHVAPHVFARPRNSRTPTSSAPLVLAPRRPRTHASSPPASFPPASSHPAHPAPLVLAARVLALPCPHTPRPTSSHSTCPASSHAIVPPHPRMMPHPPRPRPRSHVLALRVPHVRAPHVRAPRVLAPPRPPRLRPRTPRTPRSRTPRLRSRVLAHLALAPCVLLAHVLAPASAHSVCPAPAHSVCPASSHPSSSHPASSASSHSPSSHPFLTLVLIYMFYLCTLTCTNGKKKTLLPYYPQENE
ncbi:hypothetical protein PLICRDRAFT_180409 [Plicaturopsis crispa FD-325 SS-3]|uniref:Uncharacterized protein n=1 Tax=Plicaturopsis crispa FD-325 SS-3 TaxID=944288 RepID=A0A0C9T5V9_PLICR|nr:hypothetical protein PLICRDRAFT_180409 [Plicaturopsis crispa FD-325 SS-3]